VGSTDEDLLPEFEGGTNRKTSELEREEAKAALSHGARGAVVIASIAVALLFLGWLFFYFFLFMRRGNIG
jgi:hypothetical protein